MSLLCSLHSQLESVFMWMKQAHQLRWLVRSCWSADIVSTEVCIWISFLRPFAVFFSCPCTMSIRLSHVVSCSPCAGLQEQHHIKGPCCPKLIGSTPLRSFVTHSVKSLKPDHPLYFFSLHQWFLSFYGSYLMTERGRIANFCRRIMPLWFRCHWRPPFFQPVPWSQSLTFGFYIRIPVWKGPFLWRKTHSGHPSLWDICQRVAFWEERGVEKVQDRFLSP